MREQGGGNVLYEGPTAWMERGRCVGMDPEIFFPDRGGDSRTAKAICKQCPVREECLEYALRSVSTIVGVWGGTSHRERRRIKTRRRIAAA